MSRVGSLLATALVCLLGVLVGHEFLTGRLEAVPLSMIAPAPPPVPGSFAPANGASGATESGASSATSAASARGAAAPAGSSQPPAPLAPSRPVWFEAPLLGRFEDLVDLHLAADRTLEVPATASQVGWYADGPTPGERGPAVLVGHVTWGRRAAAFYPLGRLRPGQLVRVGRADGAVVTFRVRSVENLPKDHFPTERVYGPTPGPELRIVTCGGRWNGRSYPDNTVAFAEMVGDGSSKQDDGRR